MNWGRWLMAGGGVIVLLTGFSVLLWMIGLDGSGWYPFIVGLVGVPLVGALLFYGARLAHRGLNPSVAALTEQRWRARARDRAGTSAELWQAWLLFLAFIAISTQSFVLSGNDDAWRGAAVATIVGSAFMALRATRRWRRLRSASRTPQRPSPAPRRSGAP